MFALGIAEKSLLGNPKSLERKARRVTNGTPKRDCHVVPSCNDTLKLFFL